ncbi:MAG TPA: calcium-binding protein [Microvirga sp.]
MDPRLLPTSTTVLGDGDDRYEGTPQADTIDGGGGNDYLIGGSGDDRLYGGLGADTFEGSGNPTNGQGEYDTVTYEYSTAEQGLVINIGDPFSSSGEAQRDVYLNIDAFVGTKRGDTIFGGIDRYQDIFGDDGNDIIHGGDRGNILVGEQGNDRLIAGAGVDILRGGYLAGDTRPDNGSYDIATYETANDRIVLDLLQGNRNEGDARDDTFFDIEGYVGSRFGDEMSGTDGRDELYGDAGNDVLIGRGGGDYLIGEAGDDTLIAGSGQDTLYGGKQNRTETEGYDFVSYERSVGPVVLDFRQGRQHGGDAAGDQFFDINAYKGSPNSDTLIGGDGGDTFFGEAGDDLFVGSAGADLLFGQRGVDTISYADSAAGVTVSLVDGSRGVGGDAEGDVIREFENVIGSGFADRLTGNALANTFTGGPGNDTYVVGAGDTVAEAAGGGIDQVETDASLTLGAGSEVEIVTATGAANVALFGSAFANTLIGNTGANRLDGGAGADVLRGGAGNDTYVVDVASDSVSDNAGIDTVETSVTYTLSGEIENLTALGLANADLTGNALANALTGNGAANVLRGGAGDDVLQGGAGNDRLFGGAGRDALQGDIGQDIFVFDTKASRANVDTVRGFSVKDDTIWVENKVFKGIGSGTASKPKKLVADAFTVGSAAQDAEDRFIYNKKNGKLYYDQDGVGGRAAVEIATFGKNLKMTHNDFFVI